MDRGNSPAANGGERRHLSVGAGVVNHQEVPTFWVDTDQVK
jgi:hypothetical protein